MGLAYDHFWVRRHGFAGIVEGFGTGVIEGDIIASGLFDFSEGGYDAYESVADGGKGEDEEEESHQDQGGPAGRHGLEDVHGGILEVVC